MTVVVLSVAAFTGLSVAEWRRCRPPSPEPIPPAPRLPGWATAGVRSDRMPPPAAPLPPLRIADIADPQERIAAARDHARRRAFVRNPLEIGAT